MKRPSLMKQKKPEGAEKFSRRIVKKLLIWGRNLRAFVSDKRNAAVCWGRAMMHIQYAG
jgi:hypothetical protein